MNQSRIEEQYHKLAFEQKLKFLQFIYEIGERGMKMLFKFPGKDFSLWWFSLIAEKATFKSNSYEQLISILMTENVSHCKKGVREWAKEVLLFQFLNGIYRFCRLVARIAYIKLFTKNFNGRRKNLLNHDYIIASYFPLIDKNKTENNIFENRYIAPFHHVLDNEQKGRYSHICMQVNIDGHSLKEAITLVNRFAKHQSIFLIEEFLKISHIFSLIFYYLYFSILFIINLSHIKKNILYEHEGKSYNVWHIFKADFYASFCGDNLVTSLFYTYLFQRLINHLKNNSKIICICEMQAWEKALYINAKKKNIMTIGVQHTIVPELLLNYFNAPQEIGVDNFVEKCPLPDYLATVGNITADLFKKYGWSEDRVFIWGAQRFAALKDPKSLFVPWKNKENYFLCAFSISSLESQKVLLLLESAFKELTGYKILLKSHPAMDLKKLINKLELELNPLIFEHTDTPLEKVMKQAKGMIVTESSSCLYALACGSPIIVPRFIGKVDCNSLSYITNIPIYVYSSEELRSTCDEIAASHTSPILYDRYKEVLDNYLYFPESESEYLEKINHLNIRT